VRRFNTIKIKALLSFCYVFLLISCVETETPSFNESSLYIFGDSLSDVGNANIAAAGLVPDVNYYQGRFSDGLLYADILAAELNTPMKPSREYGSNYAFAGMKSKAISAQVFNYQENVDGQADATAVFIVWGGANDLLGLVQEENTAEDIDEAVDHIKNAIVNLSSIGAINIIVPNQVNLARLPRTIQSETQIPGITAAAESLSIQFNTALNNMLIALSTEDDISTIPIDTFSLFEDIIANPNNYDFDNVTEPCYVKDEFSIKLTGDETICDNPARYLFWDSIHPSTATHVILSQQILVKINEI